MNLCIFTVSNTLLMTSTKVIVRAGGCFCLKPVAMVLFMLCDRWYIYLYVKMCIMMCGVLFRCYFQVTLRES